MDENERNSVANNEITAGLRTFITDNMGVEEIKGLAFDIGIDPNTLAGGLPAELAVSLVQTMAQRGELTLLDRALRDLFRPSTILPLATPCDGRATSTKNSRLSWRDSLNRSSPGAMLENRPTGRCPSRRSG